jgi:hypothetical protein
MPTNHIKLTAESVIGMTRIVRQKLQNYHIFTNNVDWLLGQLALVLGSTKTIPRAWYVALDIDHITIWETSTTKHSTWRQQLLFSGQINI